MTMPDEPARPAPAAQAAADSQACPIGRGPDFSGIEVVRLRPEPRMADYREAMRLAAREAGERLAEPMLLSWYDRDRGFESPAHAGECHLDSATPGYVDYGMNHGAGLMIDVEEGRFVFFYCDAA